MIMEAREILYRVLKSLIISLIVAFVLGDALYIQVRLNSNDAVEWIKIEYFVGLYALILGIAVFLTPFPKIKNYNLAFLLRIFKNLCIVAIIFLPYYYCIFVVNEVYSGLVDENFMENRTAFTIIFSALLFAILFHFEQKKY